MELVKVYFRRKISNTCFTEILWNGIWGAFICFFAFIFVIWLLNRSKQIKKFHFISQIILSDRIKCHQIYLGDFLAPYIPKKTFFMQNAHSHNSDKSTYKSKHSCMYLCPSIISWDLKVRIEHNVSRVPRWVRFSNSIVHYSNHFSNRQTMVSYALCTTWTTFFIDTIIERLRFNNPNQPTESENAHTISKIHIL